MKLLAGLFYALCALALLGVSGGSPCGSLFVIGDRYYEKSIILKTRSWSTIAVDDFNNIIYRSGSGDNKLYALKNGAASSKQVTGVPNDAYDLQVHPGGVWVATNSGIYNYNAYQNSVSYKMASGSVIYFMTLAADGTLYVTDNHFALYKVSNETLIRVSGVEKAACIAFDAEGDLYYGEYWSTPIYKKKHINEARFTWASDILGGLPTGKVHLLEVDRRSNYLYICSSVGGLYMLRPGYMTVTKVEGIGPVYGIGFDRHGHIYVESGGDFMKMLDRGLIAQNASSLIADTEKKFERMFTDYKETQAKSVRMETNRTLDNTITEINKYLDNKFETLVAAMSSVISDMVDKKYSELNAAAVQAGVAREAKLLEYERLLNACQSNKVEEESWMSQIEKKMIDLHKKLDSKLDSSPTSVYHRSIIAGDD